MMRRPFQAALAAPSWSQANAPQKNDQPAGRNRKFAPPIGVAWRSCPFTKLGQMIENPMPAGRQSDPAPTPRSTTALYPGRVNVAPAAVFDLICGILGLALL